jgi:hypothetical protein
LWSTHAQPSGETDLSWQRQVELYSSFSAEQLRTIYGLRRRWLREQAERQLRWQRRQEFVRYLVKSGRLTG